MNRRSSKRLPAMFPSGGELATITAAEFPGVPAFLMLGVLLGGRVRVYALPPGSAWELAAPPLTPDAEQLERTHGAEFLRGSRLTLTAPGHRPAVFPLRSVRLLRECAEALERLERVRLPIVNPSSRRSA